MTKLVGKEDWVKAEFLGISLGDQRLNKRAVTIASSLSKNPKGTIPEVCKKWADIKGAYCFFSNKKVTQKKILAPHVISTLGRARLEKVVLAIQDTSSLNFNNLLKTENLGEIGDSRARGLICHSSYLVNDEGDPLGLLDQEFWARKTSEFKDPEKRTETDIKKKESYKWQKSLQKTHKLTESLDQTHVISIADREADIFTFYEEAKLMEESFIIRVKHNRRVDKKSRASNDGDRLFASLENSKPIDTVELEINDRSAPNRKRTAKLELRAKEMEFNAPRAKSMTKHNFRLEKISLTVISVREIKSEDKAPIHWVLVTNVEINSPEQILYCAKCYSHRWAIEVFHRILKTGCRVESIRFNDADKIKTYATFASILAWHIHWLTYLARKFPENEPTQLLDEEDQELLRTAVEKQEKKPKKRGRKKKLKVKDCILYIAKLGGFIGRKNDGFPGPEVIWRGLVRFLEMKHFLQTLQQ